MKKFITFIPRQPEESLTAQTYQAVDNERLAFGQTRFPVIPMIHGYSEPNETVRVIAVQEDYDNSRRNLEYLRLELESLRQDFGIQAELTVVVIPYDDGFETQLDTFQKLINLLEDHDMLFACITFGGKPIPIVETMALRYAKTALKDTVIRCVAYGQLDHSSGTAKIYDVTPLLQMDEILRILAKSGTKDVRTSIAKILAL